MFGGGLGEVLGRFGEVLAGGGCFKWLFEVFEEVLGVFVFFLLSQF